MGDNLTDAGAGDDEVIKINLQKVPPEVQKIVVTVTIHEADKRSQNFSQRERRKSDATLVRFSPISPFEGKRGQAPTAWFYKLGFPQHSPRSFEGKPDYRERASRDDEVSSDFVKLQMPLCE